jgi:hypothetical protein
MNLLGDHGSSGGPILNSSGEVIGFTDEGIHSTGKTSAQSTVYSPDLRRLELAGLSLCPPVAYGPSTLCGTINGGSVGKPPATTAPTTMPTPEPVQGGVVNLVSGAVGPLQLGRSTRADVIAFAGLPEFEGTGTFEVPHFPDYQALGYGCVTEEGPPSTDRIDPGGYRHADVGCTTVYYLNGDTGTLGGFWTSLRSFHTTAGTHPGTSQTEANHAEGQIAIAGCLSGISENSTRASLFLASVGGEPHQRSDGTDVLTTGTVNSLAIESTGDPVGLLFC